MVAPSSIELPILRPHRAGCSETPGEPASPRSTRGPWRAAVLVCVHLAIAARIIHWRLSGRTVSALEPSEAGLLAAEGIVNAGLILLVVAALSTLIFGRFFCGWACHLVALQDASAWLLGKFGLRPRAIRSRVLAIVPLYAAIEVFLGPSLMRLMRGDPAPELRVAMTTDDLWARFPGPVVALATFFVVGFAIVWLLGAKGFCTYGCPYGALFAPLDRLARGRIRVDADACEGCGHCTAVCTSNVAVHREVAQHGMVVDSGCMKCLDCTSACPKGALSFGFGALPDRARTKASKRQTKYDFSWPEEAALAVLFCLSLFALRRAYGQVPFLAAIAAAAILAVMSVALGRALWRPDARFQGKAWKRAGRLTGAGGLAGLCVIGAWATVAHTGWVTHSARSGYAAFLEGGQLPPGPARQDRFAVAEVRLLRADRWGLVRDSRVDATLGQLALQAGRFDDAARRLKRAATRAPRRIEPREALYRAQVGAEQWAGAAVTLDELLSLRETELGLRLGFEEAVALSDEVMAMVQSDPESILPQLLFAKLLVAGGDFDTARANLERLLKRAPNDARVRAQLDELD